MIKKLTTLDKKEIFTFVILILSLVWLKEINFLFYNTQESPDFSKYFIYVEHFFNGEKTYKDHGLMYYYLQSINYSVFYGDFANEDLFIHKSIQQVNFYIFIFGLLGYYKLLNFFKFSNQVIYVTMIFINFFPPSISMRLILKPEILAFSLVPWIFFIIEKFLKSKQIIYLILAIPLLSSVVTLKGNILGIICIYLIFTYFEIFKKLSIRNTLSLLLLLLLGFGLLSFENNSANGKSLIDLQSGSSLEESYDYKAPRSIIYRTDLYNLVTSPIKPNHASSFIGVTLLETNGDYFDLYWDNDASLYFRNRQPVIQFDVEEKITSPSFNFDPFSVTVFKQKNTDTYLYESIGLIISIFMYFHLFKNILKSSFLRKYLFFILVGMAVLLFHSITGFPKNNFDPLQGDTFKPVYYSFSLIFSFTFLVALKLKEKFSRFIYVIIYSFIIIFLLGFPKNYDSQIYTELVPKIQESTYCDIEKKYFLENSDFQNLSCDISRLQITNTLERNTLNGHIKHQPVNLSFIVVNILVCLYIFFEKRFIKIIRPASIVEQ